MIRNSNVFSWMNGIAVPCPGLMALMATSRVPLKTVASVIFSSFADAN